MNIIIKKNIHLNFDLETLGPSIMGVYQVTVYQARGLLVGAVATSSCSLRSSCCVCRSAATGAGAGNEDAADPVEAILPRREAKSPRQVHQGRGGQSLPLLIHYFYCR